VAAACSHVLPCVRVCVCERQGCWRLPGLHSCTAATHMCPLRCRQHTLATRASPAACRQHQAHTQTPPPPPPPHMHPHTRSRTRGAPHAGLLPRPHRAADVHVPRGRRHVHGAALLERAQALPPARRVQRSRPRARRIRAGARVCARACVCPRVWQGIADVAVCVCVCAPGAR
jgi:hypothetical protein